MSSNNDGSVVLALAHIYGTVAYNCQQQWKNLKKPFVQVTEGLKQIGNGLTKAKNFSNGLHLVGEGFKYIFGQTAIQKRDRVVERAVVAHPSGLRKDAVRQLIKNQLAYQANVMITSNSKDVSKQSIFTPAMIAKIYQRTMSHHFVGVQPMSGPIGPAYALEMKANEPDYEGAGRKMRLEIVSRTVTAGSRNLCAHFRYESMQDIATLHDYGDIQDAFEDVLSLEIATELDQHIIHNLCLLAEDAGEFTPMKDPSLSVMLNYMANDIARKTRRGSANFAVLSPIAVTYLAVSAGSSFVPAEHIDHTGTITFVGVLNGTIKVFQNLPADVDVLVGYKGTVDDIDAGAFDCPYIPVMSMGVVCNPETLEPEVKLATRGGFQYNAEHAKKYFAKLKLNNPFELPPETESEHVATN